MTDNRRLWTRMIAAALCFMLVAGVGIYWTHLGQLRLEDEQRLLLSEIVDVQARAIERWLAQSLASTQVLALEVRREGGMIDDFEHYAAEVLATVPGVSNLQLAPDGIIARIHPLPGNEKAIGHNLLTDDKRAAEARLAILERKLTLAGPFELIQGGVAIIGRNPVFLDTPDGERFWGFASALILLQDLLAVTELEQLKHRGYRYRLQRNHPDTGEPDVFASSGNVPYRLNQSANIQVPNATWVLTLSHDGTIASPLPGYIASIGVAALVAWGLAYILGQPETLQRTVQQKTAELEALANYDHLTGLPNRRLLYEHLEQVIREVDRYDRMSALIFLDLDGFKRINDTVGHEAGDLVLRVVSQRLKQVVRNADVVARLGGDEFAILLTSFSSVEDISQIAGKLIEAIEQPVTMDTQRFVCSASIGITIIPVDGHEGNIILRNADMAMYAAKQAGRGRYEFFDSEMQAEAMERNALENDMEGAVDDHQFTLHLQPIVDLNNGHVVSSYEGLIRWQHPRLGLLPPGRFISIAERSGHIVEMGYWVIEQACAMLTEQDSKRLPLPKIAVNLSPRQFRDADIVQSIRNFIEQSGVDPARLELEVTESLLMENLKASIEILEELKTMGVSIALDDFGTGYSSLALLKTLPVSNLKIDRSFVMDLEHDVNDREIVRGLIGMAHTLQLSVVAEGVETEGQLDLLREYGCDFAQGYLFGRPVPPDQLGIGVGDSPDASAASAS